MRWIGLMAAVLGTLLACQNSPPPEPELVEVAPEPTPKPIPELMPVAVWKRVDGSPVDENEFARDDAICNPLLEESLRYRNKAQRERQRRQYRACMAQKGWTRVLVQPE